MVLWGIIWGAIIGWLFPTYWEPLGMALGAMLGALAGWTLRNSVRSEFARLQQRSTQRAASESVAATRSTPTGNDWASPTDQVPQAPQGMAPALADNPLEAFDQRDAYDSGDPYEPMPATASTARLESEPAQPGWAEPVPGATAAAATRLSDLDGRYDPDALVPPSAAAQVSRSGPVGQSVMARLTEAVRNWFTSGNVVARVGALMLFVGLAFLAKWAADNSLFPPQARLAAIALVGIGLLVQGARMSQRKASAGPPEGESSAAAANARWNYGVLLQGLGVAVLYLAIFSAFKLYALLPASGAFLLMVAVCGLSCAIAVLRQAQVLAFVGFAGAFATPVLLSDGSGSHVSLFGYYLLLNLAIVGLAFVRPWRAVNVLGFIATFGVASAWGVLRYQPSNYATSQAFLLAFFVIYLLIGLLYALRHGTDRKHKLDATLIFGLPIVVLALQVNLVRFTEYGAALSALLGGALYIALALVLRRRDSTPAQWLVQSYAAIGLLLVTVAVPLALEQRITAAVWALEGAAIYWLSRQQGHQWGCVLGVALQALAGLLMMHVFDSGYDAYGYGGQALLPFANTDFLSSVFLVVGAWSISWWSRHDPLHTPAEPTPGQPMTAAQNLKNLLQQLSAMVSVALFVVGFVWAWHGLWGQFQPAAWTSWHSDTLVALQVLAFVGLVAAAQWAAARYDWRGARLAAYVLFPVVASHWVFATVAGRWAWSDLALWSLIGIAYLALLYRADRTAPQRYWRIVHTANVGLACLLLGRCLLELANWAQLWRSDWYAVVGVFSAVLVLLVLCKGSWWQATGQRWPLDRFRANYLLHAGSVVAVWVGLCTLATACLVRGNVQPLPYIPVLNPVDLTVLLGVVAIAWWRLRVQRATWIGAASVWKWRSSWLAIAALGFVVVNTIWLRVAHHYFGVRWQADALADSFVVQAGYSVLWTVLALLAMLWARRLAQRLLWQIGAGLLAVTVLKMLAVDLANTGGGERIVAFIAVGALMVAVGYFAPMPAARKAQADAPVKPLAKP